MKPLHVLLLLVPMVVGLWPIPTTYTNGSTTLWIQDSVVFTYTQPVSKITTFSSEIAGKVATNSLPSARIVQTAIQRTYKAIFEQNFVPWKFHPRGSDFAPSATGRLTYIKTVALVQTLPGPKGLLKPIDGQIDESYTLVVTKAGAVTITAKTALGIAYGLTTFTQLFYENTAGGTYTTLAPVHITDAPVFSHRGLNLDVARAFYPVADIERTIDALAMTKMNRLHLHITDSQSWPLEITTMPDLAAKGAYGPGMTYSPADLSGLQSYGSLRGVEVYLETDMPGHSASIAYTYPDLISAFNIQPNWGTYAAEPPSGTLKLNSPAVYSFLKNMFDDLLPRLAPYSSYYHTGGDELNSNAYTLDNTVNSSDYNVIQPLLQKFVDTIHGHVRAAGLIPIVWEEMLLAWNLKLGSDVVVQAWLSDASVAAVAQKGYKVIASSYSLLYLDCGQGQWLDFEPGVSSEVFWPYPDYCSPRHNWRVIYSYDPHSGVPQNLQHLVLGGEVSSWSEQTDPVNLDKQLWMRTAAFAEVLWSGAKDATGANRSQITASPRIAELRERLVARGVMAEPISMPFCSMGLGQCVEWNSFLG